MKLTLKNFGPIQSAGIELTKSFVLIVGPNNIGKSYTISVVYSLIKALGRYRRGGSYFWIAALEDDRASAGERKWAGEMLAQLEAGGATPGVDIDVTDILTEGFRGYLEENFAPAFQQALIGAFADLDNLQNRRAADSLSIVLENERFVVEFGVAGGRLRVARVEVRGHSFIVRCVKQKRTPKVTQQHTVIYFPEGDSKHFIATARFTVTRLFLDLVDDIRGKVSEIHYLPASRSGLYQSLSAFGQIVAELAKNRGVLRQKIELPGISEPLSDYYIKLSDIRSMPGANVRGAFEEIAWRIEQEILHGTVEFESKTKRLLFKPLGLNLSLDLSATSSMVSEISPIASYLKYVLPRAEYLQTRGGSGERGEEHPIQLLILEEPEAHLHPSVQIILIDILAQLAEKTATKIIMTSHSNYIFNKCSNLVIAGSIERGGFEAVLFQDGEVGSRTQDLVVSEYGISDENFVEVGEALYEERIRLLTGVNKNA
jgi:energy-coupling factor transporter ATP-binding protein EcfA2